MNFRVYYPNGVRYVEAPTVGEAWAIAMERWGTPPAHVEVVSV